MPVDYTTLYLRSYNCDRILNNPKLDFSLNYNENGVVLDNKRIAEHHFCKILVYDNGTVFFKGSLHKMYNSIIGIKPPNYNSNSVYKGFNGNEFTVENVLFVIIYLETLFGISRFNFVIKKIEIGLNIQVFFNPLFVVRNLLEIGGTAFEFKYNSHFAICEKSDYFLKVYDKSSQYNLEESKLRVELKTRKMRVFERAKIKTLGDLTYDRLSEAINILLKHWNKVLLYDFTINETKLTVREKNALNNKFQHIKYWQNLSANNKDKPRKAYHKIVDNYSDNIKEQISQKIQSTKISHFN
ncbi:hypothetical protein BTO06_17560 [Tenacibaculum sp. SZ-18]|uniref:hypothetical protein n=1 Tax=Tenacibaculum sp. SZ-18 TaxID=754423 RepID=UPI000C2D236B|nr:hypothetical protein [Tenacibaculum sp. SZ-18]AUC16840.1 hypothetical protein BTO06_17560 [Tenacibaculum sp. SZ-18]